MIKFGPAGLGSVKTAEKVLEEYKKFGFEICEIAFTYSNYIKKKDAKKIGEKAKKLGIDLSIHASYFINLNSVEKAKVEASKRRILEACEIGEELGAKRVVFHPGYYGKMSKKASFDNITLKIQEMMQYIKKKKWKIKLAPEVMGKINVFGSFEEIAKIVKKTKCEFCIDFAHILAREKKIEFDRIKRLFPQKKWHCHFSGIKYGKKGEKHHLKVKKEEWENLLTNLPKNKNISIICESPTPIKNSIEGLKIWESIKR